MRYILLLILAFMTTGLMAQIPTDWTELSKVRFMRGLDLSTGYLVDKPKFNSAIRKLDGQEIEISGYILPADIEGKTYVLSQNPYAACFFCGGAGMESVMNLWLTDYDKRYELDQFVKFKGILRLNDSGDGLIYLLDKAEEIR
ncbi:MAG: hypothetical protein AAFY71_08580 [Bacteroidota bacterium]